MQVKVKEIGLRLVCRYAYYGFNNNKNNNSTTTTTAAAAAAVTTNLYI